MLLEKGEKIVDIVGYEGIYAITSHGRVYSYGRDKTKYSIGMFKKLYTAKSGYVFVGLNKDKKLKTIKTARLVAIMFIPNPMCKEQVNHIDGNKENNNVDNLEWSTASENMKHAFRIGLKKPSNIQKEKARAHCSKLGKISGKQNGRRNGMARKSLPLSDDIKIRELHKNGVSIRNIAKLFNVSRTPITRAIKDNYVA